MVYSLCLFRPSLSRFSFIARLSILLSLGLGFVGNWGTPARAAQFLADWDGDDLTCLNPLWNDSNCWNIPGAPLGTVPNNTVTDSFNVQIFVIPGPVLNLNNVVIDNLTLGAPGLAVPNGFDFTIVGDDGVGPETEGAFQSNSTFSLNSTGTNTDFTIDGGTLTLSGLGPDTGTITLSDNTANRIFGLAGTERLVNQSGLIQGAGQIGRNTLAIENAGLIDANVTNTLTIDPSTSGGAINSGTLRASNGGTLLLQDGIFTNTGGTIEALAGSVVQISASSIIAGTLTTSGDGVLRNISSATLEGPMALNGTFEASDGTDTFLSGTLTNTGDIVLGSTGDNTDLVIRLGDVTLTGGGAVTLSDRTVNRIRGEAATDRLINENNTFTGAGQIGFNAIGLVNRGMINANATNTLTIDPSATGAINSGTMQATNGATLVLSGGNFQNFEGLTDGVIRADASTVQVVSSTVTGGKIDILGAGELQLSTSTVTDGMLTNSATGTIRAIAGLSTLGGTVTNPVGGQVILDDGADLRLLSTGAYANSGTFLMNSTGTNTDLRISGGDVTLTGGGTMTLSNNLSNRIFGDEATDRLINVDNTIEGAGQIGRNKLELTNQGMIDANQTNSLTINVTGTSFNNEGMLRASGTGGLILSDTSFTNSGAVEAAAGSTINAAGSYDQTAATASTVINGVLNATSVNILDGLLGGSGTVATSVNSTGVVGPGTSSGMLTIDGDYTQDATGELLIEIGGTTPIAEYDVLTTLGIATLDGLLRVELIDLGGGPFIPAQGNSFEILTATGGLGNTQFAMTDLPVLTGVQWELSYHPTSVLLEVVALLAGDFDEDGDVDGHDFLTWQRGESPNLLSAMDLADWEANYGTVIPLTAISTTVPEPASALLMVLATVGIYLHGLSTRCPRACGA